MHLRGVDGFEVLRVARDVNPSVYVVMITGFASIDSGFERCGKGAYDYLAKPFALGLEVVLKGIRDRMALELENRELTKPVGARDTSGAPSDLGWRLQAIEERLAHIEALLCLPSGVPVVISVPLRRPWPRSFVSCAVRSTRVDKPCPL